MAKNIFMGFIDNMKVSLSLFNYNYNKSSNRQNVAFGHHPDFEHIIKTRPIMNSEYFRRDYIAPGNRGFWDIVNLFGKVFTKNIQQPIKMLIAGIASSQEPFSYLATIKQIIREKPVDEVLDLHIIDLQSKPDENELFLNSHLIDEKPPVFASEGFVYNPSPKYPLFDYRVKDELFEYLAKTYNDSSKSRWESKLQEANYPQNSFDIISVNNVLYYIPMELRISAFDNLYSALKPEGYIITEDNKYAENCRNKINLTEYKPGIHQKHVVCEV